jgi:hypothetical protein
MANRTASTSGAASQASLNRHQAIELLQAAAGVTLAVLERNTKLHMHEQALELSA